MTVRLGAAIRSLLKKRGLGKQIEAHRALAVWAEVVGPEMAARAQPTRVHEGVLYVSARDPAWAQTFDLMRVELLERLNARLGGRIITELRFSSVSDRAHRGPAVGAVPASLPPRLPDSLPRDVAAADRLSAAVADPALRDAMRRALETLLRVRRAREQRGYAKCQRCGMVHEARTACPKDL